MTLVFPFEYAFILKTHLLYVLKDDKNSGFPLSCRSFGKGHSKNSSFRLHKLGGMNVVSGDNTMIFPREGKLWNLGVTHDKTHKRFLTSLRRVLGVMVHVLERKGETMWI